MRPWWGRQGRGGWKELVALPPQSITENNKSRRIHFYHCYTAQDPLHRNGAVHSGQVFLTLYYNQDKPPHTDTPTVQSKQLSLHLSFQVPLDYFTLTN